MLEQLLGDRLVLGRHHPVEELHDRHVDAEVLHHVGELDADRARAADDDRAGQVLVEDLLLVGDDVLADLHAGQHPHGRTGGDDQVVEGVRRGAALVVLDVDVVAAGERAPAVDLGDLVLLHQEVDALDDAGAHLARPRVGGAEGHRGVALDAVLVLVVRQHVRQLGVPEQRLGGDAADVQADAAPVLVLDHRHRLAQLGRADRRDVATRAGSEHQHVEVSHAAHPIAPDLAEPGDGRSQALAWLPVTLYAAYGSNLDPARMGERCPHSPLHTTGWLTGWRLTFGGEDLGWDGALSTIVEDPIEQVFVAVYDVTREDEASLDDWESAGTGLYRKAKVRVSTMTGELLVWTYVLDAYEGGLPSASYLGVLADAAEAADAPADYVASLRRRPCRSTGL